MEKLPFNHEKDSLSESLNVGKEDLHAFSELIRYKYVELLAKKLSKSQTVEVFENIIFENLNPKGIRILAATIEYFLHESLEMFIKHEISPSAVKSLLNILTDCSACNDVSTCTDEKCKEYKKTIV